MGFLYLFEFSVLILNDEAGILNVEVGCPREGWEAASFYGAQRNER
jgi:hypothetical protein